MTTVPGVPPGRAAQQWLRSRLGLATSATGLLELKLRLLGTELAAAEARAADAREAWVDSAREAQRWAVRSRIVDGARALRLATPAEEADVTISRRTVLGVRFPSAAACTFPRVEPASSGPVGPAVLSAAQAHGRALRAAADLAVGEAAVRALETEVAAVRRRVRALRDRWIPALEDNLAQVAMALEESDRADVARQRWVRRPAR